jgi:hypothetical protein
MFSYPDEPAREIIRQLLYPCRHPHPQPPTITAALYDRLEINPGVWVSKSFFNINKYLYKLKTYYKIAFQYQYILPSIQINYTFHIQLFLTMQQTPNDFSYYTMLKRKNLYLYKIHVTTLQCYYRKLYNTIQAILQIVQYHTSLYCFIITWVFLYIYIKLNWACFTLQSKSCKLFRF